MKNLTLENITKVCNGIYHGPQEKLQEEVTAITTDSRKVEKGGLFVPVVGERVDAHRFIPQVMEAGALATLSERTLEGADHPYIQVGSSLQAVKDIAEFYLEQLDIPVVGITGSVGKTSTKEVIASVLKEKYRTLKTQGNFNNELGLPLTVFRLRDEDEIAVLEMGISDFGEMTRLAKIAKPDTCVITNIGTCHLENLGDRDGVLKAKTEIFQYVKKNIVLNGDDDKLSTVKEYNGMQPVFFGNGENASVTCENVESRGLKGMSCDICLKGKMAENGELQTFHVDIPMPGRHMVYNALAAIAICRHFKVDEEAIKKALLQAKVKGRIEMIKVSDQFTLLIDYAHNAMALESLLTTLREYEPHRLVSLFGCGGNRSRQRRFEMGEVSGRLADLTIITSDNPRFEEPQDIINDIKTGMAKTDGKYVEIPDRKEAIAYAIHHGEPGDIIVLAGKGHEDYQEIKGKKYPMDERVLIREILEEDQKA